MVCARVRIGRDGVVFTLDVASSMRMRVKGDADWMLVDASASDARRDSAGMPGVGLVCDNECNNPAMTLASAWYGVWRCASVPHPTSNVMPERVISSISVPSNADLPIPPMPSTKHAP